MSKNLPDNFLTNSDVHINVSVEKARFVCSTVLNVETVFGQRKVWKESDCGGENRQNKNAYCCSQSATLHRQSQQSSQSAAHLVQISKVVTHIGFIWTFALK